MLGEARIVVQASNLKCLQGQDPRGDLAVRTFVKPLEPRDCRAFNTRDALSGCQKLADVDPAPKHEIVRIKKSRLPAREQPVAESIEESGFHVSAQIVRQNADAESEVERDVTRGTDRHVMTDAAILA